MFSNFSFSVFEEAFKNPVILVVLALILILIGVLAGYLIGNTSLRSKVQGNIDNLERDKQIQKAVLDNVGLGIAVYDSKGALFCNETIFKLPDFLKGGLPNTLNNFLETFDNGNQLKSNYILSLENGVNLIRVNYIINRKIYEIKILRKPTQPDSKFFGKDELSIVIVDDITQIKDDERRQKDLAANVSHELKTPLTSITNSVFSIKRSCQDGNEPTRDDLVTWSGRIEENAVRMQDIVNDFLVLSQCSHVSKMGIFDIRDVVSAAYSDIQDYPGASNVRFSFPEECSYPLLYGNSKLVKRTIINLLTNAIKYIGYEGKTEPDQVHISIAVIDDRVAVQVDDNGRGIPAKDIDHLFERFYRVDNSGNREVGGSGIGLAIAKEIADMHDGAISVTSTFGHGATFILSLPTGKTVFDAAYSDAKTGVISDKPLHRAAAYFLGLQECEAARSLGYKDIEAIVEDYELIPEHEVAARDKALAKLLATFGDERFDELKEELLYVEDMFDEEDGPVTGLEPEVVLETAVEESPVEKVNIEAVTEAKPVQNTVINTISEEVSAQMITVERVEADVSKAMPEVQEAAPVMEPAPVVTEAEKVPEPQIIIDPEEEARQQAKEEARKLLTQPVVQISAEQRKSVSQINRETREKHVIHPIDSQKRYNKSAVSKNGKEPSRSTRSDNSDVAVKSSLKKVLDESDSHK